MRVVLVFNSDDLQELIGWPRTESMGRFQIKRYLCTDGFLQDQKKDG